MSLPRFDVLRVRSVIRRGSSAPVIADTTGGAFVVKLRGAAQGVLPLLSEVLVGALGEALGLAVPERVALALPAAVPSDDGNDELRDLLDRSAGVCLGLRHLPGARDLRPEERARVPAAARCACLFLDALTDNLDRTPQNPNVLLWREQPWFIDHGSALSFHFDLAGLTEASPVEPSPHLGRHLFAADLGAARALAPALAARLPRAVVERAAASVPVEFVPADRAGMSAERFLALHAAYLWKRRRALDALLAG